MNDPVRVPTADFFEEYPLLKKLRAQNSYEMPRSLDQIARPPINMPCAPCKANQTFRASNNPLNDLPPRTTSLAGSGREPNDAFNSVVRAVYNCAACGWQRVFLLEFGPPIREAVGKNTVAPLYVGWVRKVGQSPPWSVTLPREVEKALGPHLKYFERGLACEGAGFGLAALAYYRRVVEELVRRLSDERVNTLSGSDRERFVADRDEARLEHSVKREIELVKDMVPNDARPGSVNPLSGL
jgi:hypothetical protein